MSLCRGAIVPYATPASRNGNILTAAALVSLRASLEVIDGRLVRSGQLFVAVLGAASFTQSLSDWIGSHARGFLSMAALPQWSSATI